VVQIVIHCRILQNCKQPHKNFPTEHGNFSLVSLSEKSERDLPTSERENGESLTGLGAPIIGYSC